LERGAVFKPIIDADHDLVEQLGGPDGDIAVAQVDRVEGGRKNRSTHYQSPLYPQDFSLTEDTIRSNANMETRRDLV